MNKELFLIFNNKKVNAYGFIQVSFGIDFLYEAGNFGCLLFPVWETF